ncbi:7845_t:CDS:2, partial [Paraglomus occultum]
NSKHKFNNTKEESKSTNTNSMPEPLASSTVASTKPKRNGLLPFASRKISEDKKAPRRVSMSTTLPSTNSQGSLSQTKATETMVVELTTKDSEKLAAGVGTIDITSTAMNVTDINNIIAPTPSSIPAALVTPTVTDTGTTLESVIMVDTSIVPTTPSMVDTGAITTSSSTPTTETPTTTTSTSPSLTSTNLSAISTTKEEKRRRKRKDDVADLSIVVADGIPVITGYPMASPRRNKDYHTLFKDVPMTEYLINDYGCALQREILAHGRMYISVNHLCFYANILGWVSFVVVPFNEITAIEKRTTAFVIPNAILITTHLTKYFFASFLARDTAYELLSKLWHHSQTVCNESECPSEAGEQPKCDGSNNATDTSETDDDNVIGDG